MVFPLKFIVRLVDHPIHPTVRAWESWVFPHTSGEGVKHVILKIAVSHKPRTYTHLYPLPLEAMLKHWGRSNGPDMQTWLQSCAQPSFGLCSKATNRQLDMSVFLWANRKSEFCSQKLPNPKLALFGVQPLKLIGIVIPLISVDLPNIGAILSKFEVFWLVLFWEP